MHSASESCSASPVACRVLTLAELAQAGPVVLLLLAEMFCKAERRRTDAGASGHSSHLPTPGEPALEHLQKQKRSIRTRTRRRSTASVCGKLYFFNRSQVGAGDEQLGQVPDPVLLLPLELIFLLQQLSENLLLCGCGLGD